MPEKESGLMVCKAGALPLCYLSATLLFFKFYFRAMFKSSLDSVLRDHSWLPMLPVTNGQSLSQIGKRRLKPHWPRWDILDQWLDVEELKK